MFVTYPSIPDTRRNRTFQHLPNAAVALVRKSVEHPTLPRHFMNPLGEIFTVSLTENSKPMTRLEVYENENT